MTQNSPVRILDWDFIWLLERAFSLPYGVTDETYKLGASPSSFSLPFPSCLMNKSISKEKDAPTQSEGK